jgi:phospholipid/cholesterol/gamma-HCH transport system substrate-binding protein
MRAIADRRVKVARLVTNLRLLSQAAATKDTELASLVSASTAVFGTIAARDGDLGRALDRLPGSVGSLDRALTATRGFAIEARPALAALRPTVRGLAPALVQVRPLLRTAEPTIRTRLRPLVHEAIPVVQELLPSVRLVNQSDPDLIRTVKVLTYVANELLYNPPGPEEGYLFQLAWFLHNGASMLSIEDAHGAVWRGLLMVGCSSAGQLIKQTPALAPLGSPGVCP